MKTYWAAPGKGSNITELKSLLMEISDKARIRPALIHLNRLEFQFGQLHRTNLRICEGGSFEHYDVDRIASAE